MLRGDVGAALTFNPLYFTLLGLAGLLLAVRLIFARKIEVSMSPWKRRLAWGVFLMLVAANWAYLIFKGI